MRINPYNLPDTNMVDFEGDSISSFKNLGRRKSLSAGTRLDFNDPCDTDEDDFENTKGSWQFSEKRNASELKCRLVHPQ
jgi:hypothetical protein